MSRELLCSIVGAIGGIIAEMFGGWDMALVTLIIFMTVDYVTGIMVASIFHKSKKTKSGKLDSQVGWKGICKKGISLLIVLVACRLDLLINTNFIRDSTVIAFILNELISIIENAGLMDVPIPQGITEALEVLKKKEKES